MNTNLGSVKNKMWSLLSGHWVASLVALAILVILVGGGLFAYSYFNRPSSPSYSSEALSVTKKTTDSTSYNSPLTGNKLDSEAATKQAATAIMIENSPSARPQSGLKDSGIIFEAIAEGGITRFLVLYQEQKPQLIGPVRSVRIYYVDWLAPFNASVAHVGGSAAALSEVRNGSYRDIDQFFNGSYYWRATDRWAPHNVYTSFAKLDSLNQSKGYTTSSFTGFARKDSEADPVTSASNINVTMSGALYNSSYVYDKKSNTYLRYQAGDPHLDREQGQIAPRVVIVMKVPMNTVMEDGYRESYATIGSGEAYIFQDGAVIPATWNKKSRKEQLYYTDNEGKVISLARGQTFISAVPSDSGGVSWQ